MSEHTHQHPICNSCMPHLFHRHPLEASLPLAFLRQAFKDAVQLGEALRDGTSALYTVLFTGGQGSEQVSSLAHMFTRGGKSLAESKLPTRSTSKPKISLVCNRKAVKKRTKPKPHPASMMPSPAPSRPYRTAWCKIRNTPVGSRGWGVGG